MRSRRGARGGGQCADQSLAPARRLDRRRRGRRRRPDRRSTRSDFERLRAWRYARAEGKPAYTVASNAVLEDLLRRPPASTQALLEIRGIGPSFCEKHGESLLDELRAIASQDGERLAL